MFSKSICNNYGVECRCLISKRLQTADSTP